MRTLDDIIPPSRRKEMESSSSQSTSGRGPLPLSPRTPKFPFTTLIALVVIIAASIGTLFYFSSAKVQVTPNTVSAAVKSSFTATQSSGSLPFEIITAQKIASQSVQGSGTKTVNSFASGTITIYNIQTKAQNLITNTRFATASGLIFRIRSGVTIPSGTPSKPGSVVTKVFADKAGSSYNIEPTSFTIPGFAGTPHASQVYARSLSTMTGGASGNVPVVDAVLEAQARSALVAALAPDLLASIKSQIPSGYLLVPGAATTTYQEIISTPSSITGHVDVKEQGTMTALIFPNTALAAAIASSVSGIVYRSEPLTLKSADSLLLTARSGMPEPHEQSFSFFLTGTAQLIYGIDSARIAAAVAGKTSSAAEVALSSYPEVKRAIIMLRPFWRQTFPQDPALISIVTVEDAY